VNRRVPSYRGVVYDRDAATLGVAIDPPDDELPDDAVWRIDLSPDEVSRLRQQDALGRAAAATGDRLAELRAALRGEGEPEFDAPANTDRKVGGSSPSPARGEGQEYPVANAPGSPLNP